MMVNIACVYGELIRVIMDILYISRNTIKDEQLVVLGKIFIRVICSWNLLAFVVIFRNLDIGLLMKQTQLTHDNYRNYKCVDNNSGKVQMRLRELRQMH